ncbi:MAG: ArsA-related P-loop ATPase [Deltaproteobacteria bacterium]
MRAETLDSLTDGRRLLVFVGEGGVGKTSMAAATALAAAVAGRHVAVLTIDPAPRLCDALGIDTIDGRPQNVSLGSRRAQAGGSLVAMRLDTKGTFDAMVEELAPDPVTAARLLANPVYQAISDRLGGSEGYVAFQRLWELARRRSYDLIVVDTPAAANLQTLMSAPLRLSALMDSRAAEILADPARILMRAGSSLARTTAAIALGILERVAGAGLRGQVADFIAGFEPLLNALNSRAAEVNDMLAQGSFVVVLSLHADTMNLSCTFCRELAEAGMTVTSVVANRVIPASGQDPEQTLAPLVDDAPTGTLEAVQKMETDLGRLRSSQTAVMEELTKRIAGTTVLTAPAARTGIGGLDDLETLAASLQQVVSAA